MPALYPLKFQYDCRETAWGGTRLSKLGKSIPEGKNCGETWELGAFQSFDSVINNGFLVNKTLSETIKEFTTDLVGGQVFERYRQTFPLLVKFIDTSDSLSVQVHPKDNVSLVRHGKLGKTEAWYVLDAQPDALISMGFKKDVSRDEVLLQIKKNALHEVLQTKVVKKGDFFFLPAGTVHAIGKGVTLCEIQQASDITYRLYDYNRMGLDGKPRELHVEEALDVIDYSKSKVFNLPYQVSRNGSARLVSDDKFTINLIETVKTLYLDYSTLDSFVIIICLDGKLTIEFDGGAENLVKGDLTLLPAALKRLKLIPANKSKMLEVYLS